MFLLVVATLPMSALAQDAEIYVFKSGRAVSQEAYDVHEVGRHSLAITGGVFMPSKKHISGFGKIHNGYYTDIKYIFKPNDMFSFAAGSGVYGNEADDEYGDEWSAFVIPIKGTLLLTIPINRVELYGGGRRWCISRIRF